MKLFDSKPGLKDRLLQKYLNPFRLSLEDIEELKREFDPLAVTLLSDCLLEKDFLDGDDLKKLEQKGVVIKKSRIQKWRYPWVKWVNDCLNTPWYQRMLPFNAKRHILIELGNLDETGISVSALIRFILNPKKDDELLAEACFSLGKIGSQAIQAVGPLTTILARSFDPHVIFNSLWALKRMGEKAAPAAGEIIEKLREDQARLDIQGSNIRLQSLQCLAGLAPLSIPQLLKAMGKSSLQKGVREVFSQVWNPKIKERLIQFATHHPTDLKVKSYVAVLLKENEIENQLTTFKKES